jgi:hypothetical protein
MLPSITLPFQNGALGQVELSTDGVFAAIAGVVPSGALETDKVYKFTSMTEVTDAGLIDNVENHVVYKFFQEFYAEAGNGAEIYLLTQPVDVATSAYFQSAGSGKPPVMKVMEETGFKIKGLFVIVNPEDGAVIPIDNGIATLVPNTVFEAQRFAENLATTNYAPIFVIVDGYGYQGLPNLLEDLKLQNYNRVGVLIGDTESRTGATASKGSCLGLLAGRLAKYQVHVNAGKVRNGKLATLSAFIVDEPVESADVTALHDKGYITLRTHVGRAGYFFSDDPLATAISDDYRQLTHRRVIDKAYRIGYNAALDFLLDDLPLTNSGTLMPYYAKTIEGVLIRAVATQMSINGELSVDPTNNNDSGVIAEIDLNWNVASTSKIQFKKFQVRPKGHARYIDVPIGFVPITSNN